MSGTFDPDRKRILVIDGYGFRGLGALYIIDKIVRCASIRAKKRLRPCDLFDLICGTSSGALIAILLGRLGLGCDTAITEYKQLVKTCCGEDEVQFWENILTKKQVDSSSYDIALSSMISNHLGSADSSMLIFGNATTGHTNTFAAVTSAAPDFSNRTHCIRSYNTLKGPKTPPPAHQWSVLEAARAASSTPFYLSPLLLDDKYGFRDSAFSGFNNPINLSRREQKILWPDETNALILSLGTDISSLVPEHIGRNWEAWSVTDGYCTQFVDVILSKLKVAATDSQRRTAAHIVKQVVSAAAETKGVHLEAEMTLPHGSYHRIDPPLGLDKLSFVDCFRGGEVEYAIHRWAEDPAGKDTITVTSALLVDEAKEINAADLRKLDPPPPPAGTVNPGYNPQLDKRRPETVMDYLTNYRVLFIVDDSLSMKPPLKARDKTDSKRYDLWDEARDALSGIAEHALKYNTHELSIAFLNSDRVCSRAEVEGRDSILKIFGEVVPINGTPTGAVLEGHLGNQLAKLNAAIGLPEYADIRPLDIIVLTDGRPSDRPEDTILAVAKEIKEKKHHPNCIGIQFVQIGNDAEAKKALSALSYTEEVGMVDTVLYDGFLTPEKLERILLGGLHPNLRTILQANRPS